MIVKLPVSFSQNSIYLDTTSEVIFFLVVLSSLKSSAEFKQVGLYNLDHWVPHTINQINISFLYEAPSVRYSIIATSNLPSYSGVILCHLSYMY